MKNKYFILILVLVGVGIIGSCKNSFLDVKPAGALDENILATPAGVEAMLIGSYALLDGQDGERAGNGWGSATTNWVYGSIRGLEANKGTDAGDQPEINPIQTYSETPTSAYLNYKWRHIYDAISRTNKTILIVNKAVEAQTITQEQADLYVKQARALRGWYHFDAWRLWGGKVPYLDETTDPYTVGNSEDIKAKIIADLTEGTNLPINMGAVGKFNKTVCQILLAEAIMQMNQDYAGALTLLNEAKASGKKPNGEDIGLAPTYGEVFDIANRNGIEAIYTVQYSVNDGSGGMNGGNGEVLNFPYKSGGSPGGCCGFFNPTQEFVNSFRTSGGLPLLDFSYNLSPVKSDQGVSKDSPFVPDTGPLDPRLDWSVGRRGIPYWDWGKHTGADWIRDQTYSGPYNPKKQVYKKSQEGTFTEVGNWTSGWTANGYRLIRYANLLLMIAECEIEAGSLDNARTLVNQVRARAANPAGFVMDGAVPAANYVINQYPATGAPFDTKDNARIALRMERKLELGQEGHRWFDLNRWGTTVTELNRALTYEKTMPWGTNLYGGATVGAEDTSFPIPQRQIDLSNGNLVQNR